MRYRTLHGRHPPPHFDSWYKFARAKSVSVIDDYTQITDDLRPFWSIPPNTLRRIVRGLIDEGDGISGLKIRNGTAERTDDGWRAREMERMLGVAAEVLPDLEVAMNRHDQPRVLVPWEELQGALKVEVKGRGLNDDARNAWSKVEVTEKEMEDAPGGGWYSMAGKEYMASVTPACPPGSWARESNSTHPALTEAQAAASFLTPHGHVHNFNLSSDLCTIGPDAGRTHGLLFSATTLMTTSSIVPVFGECKVNVNNEILFPANMYYKQDPRYDYSPAHDLPWHEKAALMFWRGVTSGGYQTPKNWRRLHRHRLVLGTNATLLHDKDAKLVVNDTVTTPFPELAAFAQEHTDVGFSEIKCETDNCEYLERELTLVSQTDLADQFVNKYLIDVDGHSFSGRWNAFLKSHSLGLKATIFREWHDSRLFAWRHFVPVSNGYGELMGLLGYFIGAGDVPSHDAEAELLASQGRRWAERVLRREDMEVYVYRLMLEYARLLDANRDEVGYTGDGKEVVEEPEWREIWEEVLVEEGVEV